MKKQYVLYKGDGILAMGTAEEIAQELGIKPDTVKWYSYPSAQRGNIIAVVIE